MRMKTWLTCLTGLFSLPLMAISPSTQLLQCPKPDMVHIQYLKDEYGRLSCEYSSHLLGSHIILRHMERSVKARCRPVFDTLTSVMVVREGAKTRMISCGYGVENKNGTTWAMANLGQQAANLPLGCQLMGVKVRHNKYIQSHCDESPLSCVIVCGSQSLA